MTHFALDPNMTEADWDAARKLARAQRESDGYEMHGSDDRLPTGENRKPERKRGMIELHANDWYTIAGRELMASVNLREIEGCPERINSEADMPIRTGEHVLIDSDEYVIRGIEYARALMYPPFIKPDVSLRVQAVNVP